MSLAIVLCNLQTHQRTIMDTEIGEELPASFHPSDAGEIGMHDMHGEAAKLTFVGLSLRFPASKSRLRVLPSEKMTCPPFNPTNGAHYIHRRIVKILTWVLVV